MKFIIETVPLPIGDTNEFRQQEKLANKNMILTAIFSAINTPDAVPYFIETFNSKFTKKNLEHGKGIFKDKQRSDLGINHKIRDILSFRFPQDIHPIDKLIYNVDNLTNEEVENKTIEDIKKNITLSTHLLEKIVEQKCKFSRNTKAHQVALDCSKALCNGIQISDRSIENFKEFIFLLNQHYDKQGMMLQRKHKGNFDAWSIEYIINYISTYYDIDLGGREIEWIYGLFLATDSFTGRFGPGQHIQGRLGPKDVKYIKEVTKDSELRDIFKQLVKEINGGCQINNQFIESLFITGGRRAQDTNPSLEKTPPGTRTDAQVIQNAINPQLINESKIYLPFSVDGLGDTMPLKKMTIELGKVLKKEIYFRIFQKGSYTVHIGKPIIGGTMNATEINEQIYKLGKMGE